jgi:hypothetical protein
VLHQKPQHLNLRVPIGWISNYISWNGLMMEQLRKLHPQMSFLATMVYTLDSSLHQVLARIIQAVAHQILGGQIQIWIIFKILLQSWQAHLALSSIIQII